MTDNTSSRAHGSRKTFCSSSSLRSSPSIRRPSFQLVFSIQHGRGALHKWLYTISLLQGPGCPAAALAISCTFFRVQLRTRRTPRLLLLAVVPKPCRTTPHDCIGATQWTSYRHVPTFDGESYGGYVVEPNLARHRVLQFFKSDFDGVSLDDRT